MAGSVTPRRDGSKLAGHGAGLALPAAERHILRHNGRAEHVSHRRRPPGQALQGRGGGRRHFVPLGAGLDHRAARRQRRRQDHDHRHDHGPGHADLRHGHGAGRADAGRALPRAAPDEFRKPLCGDADAAHRAAKSVGVRAALCRRRYRRAHRRACRRSRSRRIPRPADRQVVGRAEDPRLARQGAAQPSRKSCCSTSRRRRSIPTPPTGCAAGSSVIAARRGRPCCSPRTT